MSVVLFDANLWVAFLYPTEQPSQIFQYLETLLLFLFQVPKPGFLWAGGVGAGQGDFTRCINQLARGVAAIGQGKTKCRRLNDEYRMKTTPHESGYKWKLPISSEYGRLELTKTVLKYCRIYYKPFQVTVEPRAKYHVAYQNKLAFHPG